MTLHQEIVASAPSPNRSGIFRMKALLSEQQARESTDQRSKRDWEELAVEWHSMAQTARVSELKLPEMTPPERVLAGRRLQLGSHEKGIPVVSENKDPWVKGFLRRLSVLIHDIGRRKPS
jgi:cell division protein FtsL